MELTPAAVVPQEDRETHLEAVRQRWEYLESPDGQAFLYGRLSAVQIDETAREYAKGRAKTAGSAQAKIHWLRQDAQAVSKGVGEGMACRRGCSHCCHIGVTVSRQEAEVIGKAIGVKPTKPPARVLFTVKNIEDHKHMRDWQVDQYHGVPCGFLQRDGACGIYEDRPFICRIQINLDRDGLLCRLLDDKTSVKVPYLDMQASHADYVLAFGQGIEMADVRDWFPKGAR